MYFSTGNSSPASTIGGTWTQITNRFIRTGTSPTTTGGSDTHTHTYGIDFLGYHSSMANYSWSSIVGLDVNGKLPSPVGNGAANGGAVYCQNTNKTVWAYRDGSGNIRFENKNDAATDTYYYGSFRLSDHPRKCCY